MNQPPLYDRTAWDFERKKVHRQWISDTIRDHQKYILKNGKLKRDLCFASLSGEELVEFKWYMENRPFFTPKQYIAIDRGNINLDRVKEYKIPLSNIYKGEMEHILRQIRTQRKIAIINADFVCTIKTCISSISPLIRTIENCAKKSGECFMFVNAVEDFMNLKESAKSNRETIHYICDKFIYDYFPELDYVPATSTMLFYYGHGISSTMFSFCLHLSK